MIMNRVLNKKTMGMGDIKLIFVTALFLGFWNSIYMLFAALFLGLVFALFYARAGSGWDGCAESGYFPFGPCISLSAGIILMAG